MDFLFSCVHLVYLLCCCSPVLFVSPAHLSCVRLVCPVLVSFLPQLGLVLVISCLSIYTRVFPLFFVWSLVSVPVGFPAATCTDFCIYQINYFGLYCCSCLSPCSSCSNRDNVSVLPGFNALVSFLLLVRSRSPNDPTY